MMRPPITIMRSLAGGDPDTIITAAGGNYVEPEAGDVRLGTVYGAGEFEETGTLIPQPTVAAQASLAAAIVARFNADAWLGSTANVAGGISYQEAVENNPPRPFVQFYLSTNYGHHAAGQVQDVRLQFSIFSDAQPASQADTIMDHLMACFNGQSLTITGFTNSIAPMIESRDVTKDDGRLWQGVMIFELTIEEA